MSPPSQADAIRRLASLAGQAPDLSQDHDALAVAMIIAAKARGATWAQIGSVLIGRPDPRLAKKHARMLARAANRKAAVTISLEGLDA